MNMRKLIVGVRVLVAAGFATLAMATNAAYPDKPVKLIVPFPPGGGNDQVGRLLAERLSQVTSAQFIVENRGGAGGNIGADMVARSAPDGYTLLVASNQVVINPALYQKMTFDVMKDFTPVAMVADVQFILVANPGVKVKTVADVIGLDKKSPGTLNHGTPGNGTPQHLAAELFNTTAGTSLTHIPYKGTGPAMSDLLGGQIQLAFATLPAALPHVKDGKLAPIGVTGKSRSSLLPDVPSIVESGVKGYEATTWYGILAPAGTDAAVIATLQKAIQTVMADPEFRKRLDERGFEPRFMTGAAMSVEMKADSVKWARIVKATNVKLD